MFRTDLRSRRTVWQHTNASEPAFSHRGAVLAFAVGLSPTNSALTLFDIPTQKETRLATVPTTNWNWIGFTPDDRLLVGVTEIPGSKSGDPQRYNVTAWDVATGTQLWQRGIPHTPSGCAISPDGNSFAVANWRRTIHVLEMKGGHEQLIIPMPDVELSLLHFDMVLSLTYSPDSSQIITKGASGSSTIHIYDARTGNAAGHLDGHRQEIVGLLFTMDGKQLVSSSVDSTIRLWDWPSRKPVRVLTVPRKGAPVRLALAPDGRTLASLVVRFSTRSSQIQLWELDRPESHPSFQTIGIASYVSSVWSLRRPVFTPDSRSIIALDKDGTLTQWDVASLSETRQWPWATTNHNFYMDISQDTGQAAFHQQGGDLRVLDMASGTIRTNVLGAAPFDQFRFLGNGQFLFTFRNPSGEGETERTVQVWDARTWRPAGTFSYQHIKRGVAPLGPTFSRANVFAVDSEGKLLVRDFTQPAAPPKMLALPGESDSESAFSAFAVSPDGRLAAAGQENGALSFWNLKTSEFLRTLGEYRGSVASLVFSPDGTRLITTHGSGGPIRLWDLESGQELLTLPVQGVNLDTVFSPDGRVLAAFDVNGHLYLWSAPSWDEIAAAEAKETAEVKQP